MPAQPSIPYNPMFPFTDDPATRQARSDWYTYINYLQNQQDREYYDFQRNFQEQERQRQELERQGVMGLRMTQAGVDLATLQTNLAHRLGEEQVRTLHAMPSQAAQNLSQAAQTQFGLDRQIADSLSQTGRMQQQTVQARTDSSRLAGRGMQEGQQLNQAYSAARARSLLGF